MEERAAHQTGPAKRSVLLSFWGDLKAELHRISWTEKKELITYTKVVFASVFVGGFIIYGMDLVIRLAMHTISWIAQLFGG